MNQEELSMLCEDKPIWKDIDEEGFYQVDQYGEVRSWVKRKKDLTTGRFLKEITKAQSPIILKPHLTPLGYLHLRVFGKMFRVHRLVATAFIENPNNLLQVDHIDGDSKNNFAKNLRWASNKQNSLNTRLPTNNTSGFKGVFFRKNRERWCAWCKVDGKRQTKHFKSKEEAHAYRKQMVEKHYDKGFYIEDRNKNFIIF